MVEIVALWAFTLAASILLGEAVCRFAKLRPWSWLSGAVGISVLLALGAAGASVPGRATTMFVVIAILTLAAAGWIGWTERRHLPLLARGAIEPALLAGSVLAATLIPFLANGRVGLLGPSFNHDARLHLWAAEYLLAGQSVPQDVLGGGYPLGPHGLVAALAAGFGTGVEPGFVALLMVIPVLTAFVARGVLTDVPRPWAALVALLTALTYLLASYYAQAAFKETLQALFVLAFAVVVRDLVAERRFDPRAAPLPALLAAGSLLTYSYPGLAWIAGTLVLAGVWLAIVHRGALRRGQARRTIRRSLPALGVLAAVLTVALAPQAGRIADFFSQLSLSPSGSGVITAANVGNLVHPLSPWEALGIWLREDFRFVPTHLFHAGALSAVALGAAIFGGLWWLRRREVVVLAAAAASAVLYVVLRQSESAYLAAKALAIVSPFPVLLAARALLARGPRPIPELRVLRVAVTAVVLCGAAWSSFLALRNGQVNPHVHQSELVSLRPLLAHHDVLFLGYDDYVGWRLFGARVTDPPLQDPVPFELRKAFADGQALDFDSVTPRTLDRYDFVVTTRTAYASVAPPNFELARRTRSYEVFERLGRSRDTALLDEGEAPGAILDCGHNPRDRRLARVAGRALVRPAPAVVQAPPGMGAGFEVPAQLALPSAGRWELSMQYASPQVLTVSTNTGKGWRLPPNLDRIGPYWRIGEVTTHSASTLRLGLRLERAGPPILTADSQFSPLGKIVAVRVDRPAHWVALRRACGRYVDRYAVFRATSRSRSARTPESPPRDRTRGS
ncbi:MAG: hypothetical protein QOI98_745 [Solirubrobacteraceae bacterium]|nr:hypothetical protein [Solirubrobacteraceae bacterium]